jgi:plastocyanin
MPKRLHWFKWEAGFTLLSGWLLLDVVFFQGGGVTLVDPNVSSLSPTMATAMVIGILVGSWFVYDIFWRTPLAKNVYVGAAFTYAFIVGVLYWLSHHVSGRASFLLTGAMMGTWMATNVWVHIIPAQQGLVSAVTTGKPPSEHLAKHAKTRSRHNNYMTYPVILAMLSNHFPGVYGHQSNWIILAVLIVVASSIRHIQNTFKELSPAVLIAVLVGLLTAVHSSLTSSPAPSASTDPSKPLTATVPSNVGGPEKVANESTVGTVKGTVLLEGTPPPNKPINIGTCVSDAKGPVTSDAVLSQGGKLQNAFVWIKSGLDNYKGPGAPEEPVVLDQKGCMYRPHVVGARVGQKVVILNSDPVLHNVHSETKQNSEFNEMMPTKDMRIEKVFEKTEVPVRAKCDVHPWMSAFIGVVPHPFFAVTDANGSFTLNNVPEGEYDVEAWHEVFGRQTAKLKVKPREVATLTLTFKAE